MCGTTPCMLRGSRDLESALIEKFGISGKFQTSKCGTFTLGNNNDSSDSDFNNENEIYT